MLAVIDTNVLVSALWSRYGAPATIMSMVIRGSLIPCYDYRILSEYREVLKRPKFGFSEAEIHALLDWIESYGYSVMPEPLNIAFVDQDDKKFYEVAKFCDAWLITGNKRHFPVEPKIVSATEFLELDDKK